MIYHITHVNTYSYAEPVSLCHNLVHLTVRDAPQQKHRHSQLLIDPPPASSTDRQDFFGNPATFFSLQEPHQRLSLTAINVAEVTPPLPPEQTPAWESVRDRFPGDRSAEALDAGHYLYESPYVPCHPELAAYAQPSFPPGRPIREALLDLTRRIHAEFRYDQTATTTTTPVLEVLHNRRGVCQDFAHLEIGCLRSLGLPARYHSGYLLTKPPPGQPRLLGADASHAWLAAWCPGHGWLEVDPTNNHVPSDKHILLAWGRDYDDVSPIKGVILGGGQQTVTVSVDVVPLKG